MPPVTIPLKTYCAMGGILARTGQGLMTVTSSDLPLRTCWTAKGAERISPIASKSHDPAAPSELSFLPSASSFAPPAQEHAPLPGGLATAGRLALIRAPDASPVPAARASATMDIWSHACGA